MRLDINFDTNCPDGFYSGKTCEATTGRARKVNWLNVNKLIEAVNKSGVTHLAIAKCDVLEKLKLLKMTYNGILMEAESIEEMKKAIRLIINSECELVKEVYFAHSPESIS